MPNDRIVPLKEDFGYGVFCYDGLDCSCFDIMSLFSHYCSLSWTSCLGTKSTEVVFPRPYVVGCHQE